MLPKKNCVVCGSKYVARSNRQKYCSDRCKYGTGRCENCGIEFQRTKGSEGRFCSSDCWYDWSNETQFIYKACTKCKVEKTLDQFPFSGGKGDRSPQCRQCHSDRYRKKTKHAFNRARIQQKAIPDFAKRLRESRLQKGLTQDQVGNKLGVMGKQVRIWERGGSFPRQKRLKQIYEFFGWELPDDAYIDGKIPLEIKICPGCNEEFPIYKKNTIFCSVSCANTMENNPNWEGGDHQIRGYIKIKSPDHPYADTRGYVLEHRLVMEQVLGRYLEPHERVHHKNGKRNDNRPENLELWKVKDRNQKDPPGVRAADYHCPGCTCSQNSDNIIRRILALSEQDGLTEANLRGLLTGGILESSEIIIDP